MKKLAFIIGIVSLAVACNAIEEPSNIEKDKAQAVEQVTNAPILKASIDEAAEPETKSYLNEADWHILWTANDEISAFVKTTSNWKYKFSGATGAQNGDFEPVDGYTPAGGSAITNVYAVYPYNASNSIDANGVLTVNFPATQSYKAKSFGQGANTMVAVSPSSESNLSFKNACGYLMLKLYGNNVNVKSVSFKGRNNEAIAGAATISIQPGQAPAVTMASNATSEVVLDCGSGVTIGNSSTNYTEFWFALPPVTLSGFTITVTTTDGRVFTRSNTSSFEVVRGQGKKMAPLEVVPVAPTPTNLSEEETANTYIVDVDNINEAGYYFDATVAGNGVTVNLDFSSAYQYPASGTSALPAGGGVRVLLNQNSCVSDVAFADGKISFKATGTKGNAKIQLRDTNDDGAWVWLIWCTDQPAVVDFGTTASSWGYHYGILDRNIGAITAGVDETNPDNMYGMYYQFGNPHPYTSEQLLSEKDQAGYRMQDAIAYNDKPFSGPSYYWFNPSGGTNQSCGPLWGGGAVGNSTTKRGPDAPKTLYDPCPPGYKVPTQDFSIGASDNANLWGWYKNGIDGTIFFPYNGECLEKGWGLKPAPYVPYIEGVQNEVAAYSSLWTAGLNNKNMAYRYTIYSKDVNRAGGGTVTDRVLAYGCGVRCIVNL